jgi:hypothetical protein
MRNTFTHLLLLTSLLLIGCSDDLDVMARFGGPTNAVVGPDGFLYVSDGYYNSRLAVFTTDGNAVREWGTKGYGRGQFNNPHGFVFLNDTTIIVADRDNGRLQIFSTNGSLKEVWEGAELGRPWAVAVTPDGFVVSVDGGDQKDDAPRSGIVILDANGNVQCRFSSYGSGDGQLAEGHSVAVTDSGDIIVVDLQNNRLQRFNRRGPCDYVVDPRWSTITDEIGIDPLGVAIDGAIVYVTQQEPFGGIVSLDLLTGNKLSEIASGLVERAHSVSVDPEGTLWVTDVYGERVFHLGPSGENLLEIGGR